MGRKQDRVLMAKEICKAAKLYKEHLVGKKFLYVFEGRYIEVIYKADNFRHLTGVDTSLSAKDFYKYANHNKLQAKQIYFSAVHPFSLCKRKIKHICEIATLASSENFMLEEIQTDSKTYKFGTTDLKFSLCMNREKDEQGNYKSECYIVQSLRDEDCFSKSKTAYEVSYILVKQNDEKKYKDVLYKGNNFSMEELPDEIKQMIVEIKE